ncbi:MAG: amino acid adenylation domain-containing protein [Bacteroidota bacterium]
MSKPKNKKPSVLDQWLKRKKGKTPNKGITAMPEGQPAPLSYGQQRLWLLQQLYPGNPFYQYGHSYHFRGALDRAALLKSFERLMERHSLLRTVFVEEDGQRRQVAGAAQLDYEFKDLSTTSGSPLEQAHRLGLEMAGRPFDLREGPLLRLQLFQLGEEEHFLILAMHHIIGDRWSLELLNVEWAQLYAAELGATSTELPPLSVQYADYAYWQQKQPVNQKGMDYWLQQLSGELPQLMLPTDRPRPLRPSFKGGSISRRLSPELSERLRQLSTQLQVTPYVLFLAAFKVLLYRYTGQTDLLVGTPFTNRDRMELQKLIGFFNETLVMRSQLSAEMSFKGLVEQLRKTTLDAFAHKNTPFDALVKALKPERHGSANPLFQVMFLYNTALPKPAFAEGLTVEEAVLDLGVSKFDLTLFVNEHGDYLEATFEYAAELFAASTIERWLEHWAVLLEGIAQHPDSTIVRLPLLPDPERQLLLDNWNQTQLELPAIEVIHDYIEQGAVEHPDQTAVVFAEDQLSYQQLNQNANALAHALIDRGVEAGQVVGLYIHRSVEMMVGILGILKAGAAYLPLDPNYPADRITFMLEDAEVSLVVCSSDSQGQLPPQAKAALSIETAMEAFALQADQAPDLKRSGDQLAYIIYTSGSTGKPKGVPISHRNLIHSTAARFDFYQYQPGNFLLLSSFSFDSSIVGIFWTVCSGGTLVLPPRRIEQDIEQLTTLIAQHQVTHTLMLPSLYKLLLEFASTEALRSLNTVMVAGEACPSAVVQQHFERLPEATLYNEYGPTEASVWCIAHQMTPADAEGLVPIGRPIPNARIYLLDSQLRPVPIGVPGELYVGGLGVAGGYLKRPELTAERFIDWELDGKKERLYKTGDLAKYRSDGIVDFLGRADQQVKIRGFRVEPDEIAAVLLQFVGVQEALVIADTEAQRLLGYVAGAAGLDAGELRRFLKAQLPEYMVPSAIVLLEEFPRLPNGKVNRAALPAADEMARPESSQYVAPRDDIEQQLAEVWEDVLKRPNISIHDNFFEIGGDSILSIAIIAKARQADLILAPNQLFEHQTIAELAAHIGQQGEDTQLIEEELITNFPLSFFQQAFLYHSLYHDSDQGLLQLEFWIRGTIDPERMEQAWQQAIEQHPVMRTSIHWEELDKPEQHIEEDAQLPWTHLDWREQSEAEQVQSMQAWKAEDQAQPLELSKAPISRIALIRTEADRYCLLWTCHHILLDGWSAGLVLRDALLYYDALSRGEDLRLEPVPGYGRYLAWLERQDMEAARQYWTAQYRDYEKPVLPEAAGGATGFATHSFQLSEEASQTLQDYCRQQRTTLNTLLQGLWALLLGQYLQTDRVVFGTTVSGRFSAFSGIERMTGLFMNVLPNRLNVPQEQDFADWLRSLQQEQVKGRRYEEVSLDQITQWLDWPSHSEFFDTLFVFGNFLKDGLQAGELRVEQFIGGFTSTYPLTVRFNPLVALEVNFRYNTQQIPAARIEWLAEQMGRLLNGVVELQAATSVAAFKEQIQPYQLPTNASAAPVAASENSDIATVSIAPRTPTELRLSRIWASIFDREVGVNDHFFEIGGRSVLAMQLFARIEAEMDIVLSPVTILKHPTIEALARLIDGEEEEWSSAVVPLRSVGVQQPLFCLHSGGAHVLFYRDLANRLGANQPVYAIQPPGLEGDGPLHGSIEEMAAFYIEEMRRVQPQGPYAVLGTCFSNAVALEMGHQLQAVEQDLALMLIIDSGPAHLGGGAPNGERRTLHRFAELLRRGDWSRIRRKISGRLQRQQQPEAVPVSEAERKLQATIDSLNRAYAQYHWQPFKGTIHLVRSSEFAERKDKRFHLQQWEKLAGEQLEVSVVPGHHLTLFEEPEVGGLAQEIERLLALIKV